MLMELRVADLGVVSEAVVPFGSGMTALTGETGAGKTMIVTAIGLLLGDRADPALVRSGATEAVVDGRFVDGDDEVVLSRVVPAAGRSRAYVDGRPVTSAVLAERGRALVDLHGQHTQQSLLSTSVQRAALDRFGEVDLAELAAARAALADIERRLQELGGDDRARAREADLLRFQLDELEAAGLDDPDEEDLLAAAAERLGAASARREAAARAAALLGVDDGAEAVLGAATAALESEVGFDDAVARLVSVTAEVSDLRSMLRDKADNIEEDPARLAAIGERRELLRSLRRKYGDTVGDVMAERDRLAERAAELDRAAVEAEALEADLDGARQRVAAAARAVGVARRSAAPRLAAEVQSHLGSLALEGARVEVSVGDDPGDDVAILLAADPGSPLRPLARAASGGELSRVMLALRLVVTDAPATLIFDEVDAGVGGAAAAAVGAALARVAERHQVLVVTHLAQVAAAADHQVVVHKEVEGSLAATSVSAVTDDDRLRELARMLSGRPDSTSAQRHARELLEVAAR
ncbi:MAG: DNA repair protein RecN [Acidimicrobiia bacterium]|nr:DNA repair protein RecN [Acidimicrobiia bacterium]